MSSVRRIVFEVHGRVQGVGFRWSTRRAAERIGVVGWVRNEADGSVTGEAQGEPDAVAAFEAYLRDGPPLAAVSELVVTAAEPTDQYTSFAVV